LLIPTSVCTASTMALERRAGSVILAALSGPRQPGMQVLCPVLRVAAREKFADGLGCRPDGTL